jgi:uncharacterized membrane protein
VTSTLNRSPSPVAPEAPPPARTGLWYALVLAGGLLGAGTAAWQTVDRIAWAADPTAGSICEINAVLSCSSVFSHWQSSALGIPNSLVALPLFGLLAATGLAGQKGSRLAPRYLATVFGLNVFFAAFIVWYLEQSAFPIGVLCLFCLGCGANAVLTGVGLTRVVAAEQALGRGRLGRELGLLVDSGADLILWAGVVLVVAAMLGVGLAF